MNYEEANQVLSNTKFGIFEPNYKVTQALIIIGDIDRAIEHEQYPTKMLLKHPLDVIESLDCPLVQKKR